jgi:hypothetical protein
MARKDNNDTAMKKQILTVDSEVVLRFTVVGISQLVLYCSLQI